MEQMLFTLAGGVITALSGAVVVLWKKNGELSEKRLQDLLTILEKNNETIAGLTKMIEQLKDGLSKSKRGS